MDFLLYQKDTLLNRFELSICRPVANGPAETDTTDIDSRSTRRQKKRRQTAPGNREHGQHTMHAAPESTVEHKCLYIRAYIDIVYIFISTDVFQAVFYHPKPE